MIVLLGDGEMTGQTRELLPGACDSLHHDGFRKAYEAMAAHAGMTLPEAVEARYAIVEEEMKAAAEVVASQELQQEMVAFGEGPPQGLAKGSEERTQWFARWVQEQSEQSAGQGNSQEQMLHQFMRNPSQHPHAASVLQALGGVQQGMGALPAEREPVVAAEEEELRTAITEHFALQWDERYRGVSGKEGIILKRDDSDNTSQVKFHLDGMTAWFPNETLRPPTSKVADLEQLRADIEESTHIEWDEAKH